PQERPMTEGRAVAATLPDEARRFYTAPAAMSCVGDRADAVTPLPRDLGELCRVVQGLLLHEHWAPAYKVAHTAERRAESHIRPVERMLAQILDRDPGPLTLARKPGERLIGVCRHFALLFCAVLR